MILIYTKVSARIKQRRMRLRLIRVRLVNWISPTIQPIYEAMGRKEVQGFTVPAINIRAITYDVAQAVFRAAMKAKAGPIIFEIARSEIDYTRQRPAEYACAIKAAAIKTGYKGPVFLQGDHFQSTQKIRRRIPPKKHKREKSNSGAIDWILQFDIDTSTLWIYPKATVKEQRRRITRCSGTYT